VGGILLRASIIVLLVLATILSGQAKVQSEFTCTGKDATLTFYNYLREPSLDASGYTRGLKTGSINYLVDGKIYFSDKISYYYGETNDTGQLINYDNSTVLHTQDVDFSGEKGISEFYGKGFFKNNRAISAWKKIRYDDVRGIYGNNGKPYDLGETYLSPVIKVNASVDMDMQFGASYNFDYHAKVDDGVLEAWDATGWTNKTGARRIDWEQNALMKGRKLDVINKLSDFDLRVPAAGSGDWLPCCMGGTVPPIEGLDSGWPSDGTRMTLLPPIQPPGQIIVKNCANCKSYAISDLKVLSTDETFKNSVVKVTNKSIQICPSTNCISKLMQSTNCTSAYCPGYECIYSAQEGAISGSGLYGSQVEGVYGKTAIAVSKGAIDLKSNEAQYIITTSNPGDTSLGNIHLLDTLPEGMRVIGWAEVDTQSGKVTATSAIQDITSQQDKDKGRTLELLLGNMPKSNQAITVLLNASIDSDALAKNNDLYLENRVIVRGEFKDTKVENSAKAVRHPSFGKYFEDL
jgi:hypothetical protein